MLSARGGFSARWDEVFAQARVTWCARVVFLCSACCVSSLNLVASTVTERLERIGHKKTLEKERDE